MARTKLSVTATLRGLVTHLVSLALLVALLTTVATKVEERTNAWVSFWLLAGLVAGYFAFLAMVRALWRFHVSSPVPDLLVAGGRGWWVYRFTGLSSDPTKTAVTNTSSTSTMSGQIYEGTGSINASHTVTTSTKMHDQFFLTAGNGQQHGVQLLGVDVAVGRDQVVSCAWAVRTGRSAGPCFLVVNHSTGVTTFVPAAMRRMVLGRVRPVPLCALAALSFAAAGALLASGVFVAVAVVTVVALRVGAATFGSSGTKALRSTLDSEATPYFERRAASNGQAQMTSAAPAPETHAPVGATIAPPPPPSWRPDPTSRHEFRFWDGSRWTEHVSDGAVQSLDPLAPQPGANA